MKLSIPKILGRGSNTGGNSNGKGNGKKPIKKMELRFHFSFKDFLFYLFIAFVALTIFASFVKPPASVENKPLSTVLQDIKDQKVDSVSVADNTLTIKYKNGQTAVSRKESDESFIRTLEAAGINPDSTKITVQDTSLSNNWINILSNILPLVLMGVFFFWVFRQARGAQDSIMSFGSSRAKPYTKDQPKVTFSDVAGVDEAKQELTEVVDFLKSPRKYQLLGARTPKGVLLIGPAGTGKTLLAKAVAGEAGVPFFSMAGSEFMEMLVGVGASRVRDLFAQAKKAAPAIIFIDEIDAIGRQRGMGLVGGHDEREQTLNQILVEMDGFAPNENVIVMAATNRPDVLDPALIRPGRFDRRVSLDLPDKEGRLAILKIHMRGKPFTPEVNWDKVAKRTVGFSGADLENMLNEAAILAARLGKTSIDPIDIEEAATKVKLGPEKKRLQSDLDRKMTAYHEAGHAVVIHELPHLDPVHRVSIVSRAMTLGQTFNPPEADRLHETKSHLLEQIAAMMGGRVAEQIIFNDVTTGAVADIQNATSIAREMVTEFGMSNLGPVNFGDHLDSFMGRFYQEPQKISEDMSGRIDQEIKRLLDEGMQLATDILKKNKKLLDKVAEALIARETLEGEEFEKIMGHPKVALAIAEK